METCLVKYEFESVRDELMETRFLKGFSFFYFQIWSQPLELKGVPGFYLLGYKCEEIGEVDLFFS